MKQARRLVTRPVTAALILMAVYLVLGLVKEPRAHMVTDTGMRAATIRTMELNGGLAPDVGYWAERWDPEGRAHPLLAQRTERGWVGVGTLPTLYVERALFHLWGIRGALLVPMLGSVLCALGAWYLARSIAVDSAWAVFWIVGLGSPVALYAIDLWDHAIGLGMMTWGIALLLDCRDPDTKTRWWLRAAGGGLLIGAAMTLRAEVAVFGAVSLVVVGAALLAMRRPTRALAVGGLFTLAFLVPIGLNQLLEQRALGKVLRPSGGLERGTPVRNIMDNSDVRLENAFITTLALGSSLTGPEVVVAGALPALLILAIRKARAKDHLAKVAMAGAVVIYMALGLSGFGFVPSLFVTTPVALVGVLAGWRKPNVRPFLAIAVLALPLVWLTSPTDGAAPQWGGRYVLMSGMLLTPVGVAALWSFPRWLRLSLVGLAVAVTMFGMSWLFVRTNRVAGFMEKLEHRPEQVLVSTEGYLWREGGSFYNPQRRWLVARSPGDDVSRASGIIRSSGFETFALVEAGWTYEVVSVPGFCTVGRSDRLDFLGSNVRVTSYRASDDC